MSAEPTPPTPSRDCDKNEAGSQNRIVDSEDEECVGNTSDSDRTRESNSKAKELQANFVFLSILSKYYKRVFRELFLIGDASDKSSSIGSSTDCMVHYHRFGWLIFLALRNHGFSRIKDLVTCTTGLVSILGFLIIHVPACFRKFDIYKSSQFVKKGDKVDLIASLCKLYETSEGELKNMVEKLNKLVLEMLEKESVSASESKSENLNGIDTHGFIFMKDLIDEALVSSFVMILEKDYEDVFKQKGEIDERSFLKDDSLLASGSLSDTTTTENTGTKRKLEWITSPTKSISSPLTPLRSAVTSHMNTTPGGGNTAMTATPVSTAMNTAKWLRNVIVPLPSEPSSELHKFFSSCDKNITNDVKKRVQIILEAIFPTCGPGEGSPETSLMDNVWAEQRRLESVKLYYRVLHTMCIAEAQVLHANNLTSLLANERFHRCMLACCAELVLATHKTVTMLFPTVLERTGITAFDLSKVIESFIRHEETLPRELRRHLNALEERLLESMVWEKGSSMYNSLIVARPGVSAEITRLGLLSEPMPSLDAIAMHVMSSVPSALKPEGSPYKLNTLTVQNGEMRSPKKLTTEFRSALVERNSFTSPVKDRLLALNNLKSKLMSPALQSVFASPTRPSPGGGGETCAETAIKIFFGKTMKLAAVRINGMVERLQQSQQMREAIYSLFQKILSQRTSLFFNRHIDQIILCCFYGVAKISQLNLTFKEIVNNYRKQPQCKPHVFRNVFIDWTATSRTAKTRYGRVDIITFYNEVFIPAVKPLLVELNPSGTSHRETRVFESGKNNDGEGPLSPKTAPFPHLPDMSPKKVSATHNVFVSPLQSSKVDALISNSSKSYYACVGESTHAFQSPSKDLTAINNRLNGNNKKRMLNFDEVDAAGLVSDSLVARSLCLQNSNSVKSEQPDN